VTCRSSGRHAACMYSLIRPLRRGFRRICRVSISVAVAWERHARRRGRAGRCPGADGPCCSVPGIRSGRRAGVPGRGSAHGPGARGAGCRQGVRKLRWTTPTPNGSCSPLAPRSPTGCSSSANGTWRAILNEYEAHYNRQRPHRSRQLRPPRPDPLTAGRPPERIKRRPVLGGLINEYHQAA
jgi:hypothetical protein